MQTFLGLLDPIDYGLPIITLFLKRLNDTVEENAEKLIQEGKVKKRPMITRIDITSLFQKRQDGQFFQLHQKILVRRLTMYAE